MIAAAREVLLEVEAEETVRLLGVYSPRPKERRRGLILLLHGWLGSAESAYMLGRGEFLFNQGYSVFRLNMRDHGNTTRLNEGIFHACRLEEVFQAARQIAALEPDSPFFIVGFSMGGSFALRLAWRYSENPIATLKQAIAICPSAYPEQATIAIDKHLLYRHYFRRKWRNNLAAKQAAFPHLYDFSHILTLKTCADITDALIAGYSEFPDAAAYYSAYAFTPDKLRPITIPTAILTAADDPIIPASTFKVLEGINPLFSPYVAPYGGHVGFIDIFPFRSWLNQAILSILDFRF